MASRIQSAPRLAWPAERTAQLAVAHASPASFESLYLALLIFASFLDLWTPAVTIVSLHLRASEILVLPGILILLRRHRRAGWRGWCPPFWLISILLCLLYLGWTLINSLEPDAGLAHSALLALNVLHYWVFAVLAGSDWQQYYRALRGVVVCIGVMGLWMGISYELGARGLLHVGYLEGLALGSSLAAGGQVFRLDYGVLGGCVGSWAAIISLGYLLTEKRRRWLAASGVVMGSTTMVLGLSRGAIVALATGLMVLALLLTRLGRLRLILGAAMISALTLALGAWVLLTYYPDSRVVQSFEGRVALLLNNSGYDTGTVEARLESWSMMLADVRRDPFWGQGGDSYHIYFPPEVHDSENFSLEILHATGIWGLASLLILVLGVSVRAYRTLRAPGLTPAQQVTMAAVLSALVGLFVASQTNPIGWSALFWLGLGLVAAGTRLPGAGHNPIRPRRGILYKSA